MLRHDTNNDSNRWSEHGLGHLLNPIDPESHDREWIADAWLKIIRAAHGLPTEKPDFADVPAVGRITVSSPAVARVLETFNEGKPYAEQIKPFNFLVTCHVQPFGHPVGVDPERFHLIAPYESDSRRWARNDWIDQYSGDLYRITTTNQAGRNLARVKTYGDILCEYEFHPEAKCADSEGNPCGKQTVGLLQCRHIRIELLKFIGKESNSLEEVEAGLLHSEASVYTEYPDPQRDEWETKILPALRKAPLAVLVEKCQGKVSRRALIDARAGRSMPHEKHRKLLKSVVGKFELI